MKNMPLKTDRRINKNGYVEVRIGDEWRLFHRIVYEDANGPIPEGYHVNHIDGDKSNNDIRNLQALSPSDHGRVTHLKEISKTHKTCKSCSRRLPIQEFLKNGRFQMAHCRECRMEYGMKKRALLKDFDEGKGLSFEELRKEDAQAMDEIDELRKQTNG